MEASRPSSARKLLLASACAATDEAELGRLIASGANLALEKSAKTAESIAKLKRLPMEVG